MSQAVPNLNIAPEFNENLPRRLDIFIPNRSLSEQLERFITSTAKIFVLSNPLLEHRKAGIGKKICVSEFCYFIKSRLPINIKWLDAQSPEIFQHELDNFALDLNPYETSNEALFRKLESLNSRTLLVIQNITNWETVGELVSRIVESNKCKAILISRLSIKLRPDERIKFVHFDFEFNLDDIRYYLKLHLQSKVNSDQLNFLVDFLNAEFRNIVNPFELEKLTFYIKFNCLYSMDDMLQQLRQTQAFRVSQIVKFVEKVDLQAFRILLFAKYLYAEFIPVTLLLRLLSKRKFEIQNSIKLLLDLDLAELCEFHTQNGLKVSRLVLNELKNEPKAEIEEKLAEYLSQLMVDSKSFFYPSAVVFLSHSGRLCVPKENAEFNKNFSDLCFLVAEYNSALMRFERAIKFAEMGLERLRKGSINAREFVPPEKFASLLGMAYSRLGKFEKSMESYRAIEDTSSSSTPYFVIGKNYFELRNYANASKYLKKAYESKKPGVVLIECLEKLAVSQQHLKKFSSACDYNLELIKLIKANPKLYKKTLLAQAYIRLGIMAEQMSEPVKSLENFEKAYEIMLQTTDGFQITWLLIKMGSINLKLENYDEALNDLKTASEKRLENEEIFNLLEQAEPLDLVAICHRRQGTPNSALKYVKKALQLKFQYHGNGTNMDSVFSYISLGLLYRDLGEVNRSENLFSSGFDRLKVLSKIEVDRFTRVEKWNRNTLNKYLNNGNGKKFRNYFSRFDGKALTRAYLLAKNVPILLSDFIGRSMSDEIVDEFIDWFENISVPK